MDNRSNVDDDKVIEALRKVLLKVPESDKKAVQQKIDEILDSKKHKNEYQHDFTTPKHVVKSKMDELSDQISEIDSLIEQKKITESVGRDKQQYIKNKLFFLKGTLDRSPEAEDAPEYPPVTGLLKFDIKDLHVDSLLHCKNVCFYLDGKLQHEVVPGFVGVLNFYSRGCRIFEIIVHGPGRTVLAYVFCPVWGFVRYRGDFTVHLNLTSARIATVIEFQKNVNIVRHRAEILRMQKFSHDLKASDELAITKCGVCNGAVSMLKPGFRCSLCDFNVHRGCTDNILFDCPKAPKVRGAFRRGYTIPHTLEVSTSLGLNWCAHCGRRIKAGTLRKCQKCDTHCHKECAGLLFASCGLTLQQRLAICAFKPVAPLKSAPLARVTLDDFDLLKILGQGSFGLVTLARHRTQNVVVALKALSKQQLFETGELPFIDNERRMLAWVAENPHPFLVGMKYCFFDASRLFLGMELLPGGDLLKTRPKTHQAIRLVAAEIVLALGHLHDNCIIFRDIKLENIMVGADGHIKLADYGLCKVLDHPLSVTKTFCGTPCTTAPEVFSVDGYQKDVDWFGLGCVLYELYEGENPFSGCTTEEVMKSILTTTITYTDKTPKVAQDLISNLLSKDPEKRIGYGKNDYKDIQKHEYFKKINWDWVLRKKYSPENIPKQFDIKNMKERVSLPSCPERKDLDCYFNRFPNE